MASSRQGASSRDRWPVFALAFLCACSSSEPAPLPVAGADAGDTGADVSDAAIEQCGMVVTDDPCSSCLINNCCEESAFCSSDAACTELGACLAHCDGDDPDCASACTLAYPEGAAPRQAVLDCRAHACSAPCGVSPSVCGAALAPGACSDCLAGSCCHEVAACAANWECAVIDACLRACGDDACQLACFQAHPGGYAPSEAQSACLSHLCTTACEVPPEDACGARLADGACHACAVTACCDELYALSRHTSRAELRLCADACPSGDDDCRLDCAVAHPEGFGVSKVLDNCLFTECGDACASMLGDVFPCGERVLGLPAECRTCVEQNLCEEFKAAGAVEAYWQYLICGAGCGTDSACAANCCTDNLEGCGQSLANLGYMGTACLEECKSAGTTLSPCGAFYWEPCDECMYANCCDEARAMSEPQGAAYTLCNYYCETPACRTQCSVDFPDGAVVYNQAIACEVERCGLECGYPAQPCGVRYGDVSACAECVVEQCCDEQTACAADFDCSRIDLCRHLQACSPDDPACLDACRSANPAGVELFDALVTCRTSECSSDCGGG